MDHILAAQVEVTRALAVVQAELEVIAFLTEQAAVAVRPDIQEMAATVAALPLVPPVGLEAAVAVVVVTMAVATMQLRQEVELEY